MRKTNSLSSEQRAGLKDIINKPNSTKNEVRRAQAIPLLDNRTPTADISDITGLGRSQVFELRKRYVKEGAIALFDKRIGKPKELLTGKRREELIEIIKTKSPKDCIRGCNQTYRTTGLLGRHIKDEYKAEYKSRTSLYLLFRKATFTYHKPGLVSERRDPQEIKKWREKTRPKVAGAWDNVDTAILTEDEMHLSNQTTTQKIRLPQGDYPGIEVVRKHEARSIYGFLDIKTGKQHAFKTKWRNMYITVSILKKIRKIYPTQKILLLWDQAGWHRGSEAQKFIKMDGKIETLYFPTTTPEENPQEHVWKAGRSQISHNTFMPDIDVTTNKFVKYLNTTTFPYSLPRFSPIS
jgi:transposase